VGMVRCGVTWTLGVARRGGEWACVVALDLQIQASCWLGLAGSGVAW